MKKENGMLLTTVNWEIFVLNNFLAIIFHVKIFSYASRPYENILTTGGYVRGKAGRRDFNTCSLMYLPP